MAAAASDGVDARGDGECRGSELLTRGDEYGGGRESISGIAVVWAIQQPGQTYCRILRSA